MVPLQDLFGLGSEARMNTPGNPEGNWTWRAGAARFTLELAARLRRQVKAADRLWGQT